jgi:hypothetical protein
MVGTLYLFRAVVSFFICINTFKDIYPIDANVWDSIVFVLTELFCSFLIGYSRHRQDNKNIEKFNFDSIDFNHDINKVENNDDDWMNLDHPLLDKKEHNIFKE